MSVLRIHKKQNNFVILDKSCLNDEKLSWGSKGLHAYLISLPDDWQVRVCDLQKRSTNGRDAVRSYLNELERAGYIKKSPRRNEGTGRFAGIEFLVLESPSLEISPNPPETEKLSSVANAQNVQKNPKPETPSPGFPSSENPTLTNNNKININKLNNKTAEVNQKKISWVESQDMRSAAVNFSQNHLASKNAERHTSTIHVLSQEDSLIGLMLTSNQMKRVEELVGKLSIQNKEQLIKEICYCLLNKAQFTGCADDFSKKLNAIRSVIVKGNWQTPVGMIIKTSEMIDLPSLKVTRLKIELQEAIAEANHFKKLLLTTNVQARANFETVISKAQQKIYEIEGQLAELLSSKKEACG